MIETVIDQDMLSAVGNIEMPQIAISAIDNTNTVTVPCCILLTLSLC